MRPQADQWNARTSSPTTAPRVLVIDQDAGVRRLLRRELTAAGYFVHDAEPAREALGRVATHQFDLLILDIDSPASGGPEAIRIVREFSLVPILALSARGEEDSPVGALDVGADDWMQKPFGVKELLARVRNALRRRAREQGKPLRVVGGDLEIDLLYRRVRLHGHDVHLPLKSYEVLRTLAENAGKVLTHQEILAAVWGPPPVGRIEYLRMTIQELRRRLEVDPAHPLYILTEPRVGYRLDARCRM
jgi:two-component system, OmpR family, KDP operon response regulator KdpE